MTRPVVTVVIPVMGHPVLVDDAIASVVAAMADTTPDAAVIKRLVVVNDGCDMAQTRASLAAWRALLGPTMIYRSTLNRGLSAARNLGIELAFSTGAPDAIFFLDADNRLAPEAARTFGRLLASDAEPGWFYPDFDFFGRDGHYIREAQPTLTMSLLVNHSEAGSLVRRAVFDAGVRFDETLRRGYEDWDFFLSALEAGFSGKPAARPMLEYRKRPSSMLADSHLADAELRQDLRARHRCLFSPSTVLTAEAREFPRYAFWDAGASVRLGSDPDAMRPVPGLQLERDLFAHLANPYDGAVPSFLVTIEPDTEQALRACGALRAVLWNLERAILRDANPLQLVHLQVGDGVSLSLRRGPAASGKSVVAMVATDAVAARLRAGEPLHVPSLHHEQASGFPFTSWQLSLPDSARLGRRRIWPLKALPEMQLLPDPVLPALPADELIHGLLLKFQHSRFHPALEQSWEWREPGGAASRARSIEPARNLASGGVALPLVTRPEGLNIAFVVPLFSLGGVEKVVLRMSEALKAHGHACHLVVTGPHPIHLNAEVARVFASVNPFPDPSAADWAGADYMGTNETSWGSTEELADLEGLLLPMDVVINHHSAALHKIARRLRRRGVITLAHEHLVEISNSGRNYGPPLLALAYENAYDRILTCSRTLADWLAAYGVPAEKLMPIVNAPGYTVAAEQVTAILAERRVLAADEPLRVLYLGRFDRQKGIEHVAEIYAQLALAESSMRLTVAGSRVISADDEVSFDESVINLGPLRDAAAVTIALADADILVLPSRYEGLPLVILEAQRLGVVPIVTDVGAVNEAVRQAETGFIVPLCSVVPGTVATILALNADRALLTKISQEAAAASRSWDQAINPLLLYLASRTTVQEDQSALPV